MSEATDQKFTIDEITFRVQKLFAKANDPAVTPQESELFRAKAEALMIKYRVDAAKAQEDGTDDPIAPTWSRAFVGYMNSEWSWVYYSMASYVARATGVRIAVRMTSDETGRHFYEAEVCGFSHDIAFFNLVLTNVLESFSMRLDPKVDPTASDASNALRLRQGGWERNRIAVALGLCSKDDLVNVQKGANRKVTKMIKDEATRLNTPEVAEQVLGRGFNAKTYRSSYAQGFMDTISFRLWKSSLEGGDGLVLKRAKEAVDEAWYEKYPASRPSNAPVKAPEPCAKCAKAKSGRCRDHSFRAVRPSAVNSTALSQGRAAAREVNLSSNSKGRLS